MSKERTDLVSDFLTQNKIITSPCISNSFEYVYKITLLEDSGGGAGEGVGGGAGEGGTASLVGQLCLGRGCRVWSFSFHCLGLPTALTAITSPASSFFSPSCR